MSKPGKLLEEVLEEVQKAQQTFVDGLPPVEKWNPDLNGDMDMRIDREGNWFYQGGRIEREAMVRMFSSILKREGNEHYLVTPVEKWRIQVDVAPFVFVALKVVGEGRERSFILTTKTGEDVLLGQQNPFWMAASDDDQPQPLARVHRNLNGLLNRNIYYELVELCETEVNDKGEEELCFYSDGCRFSLGSLSE